MPWVLLSVPMTTSLLGCPSLDSVCGSAPEDLAPASPSAPERGWPQGCCRLGPSQHAGALS